MPNKRKKRKRGGQPGNTNTRKHGFYAAGLTAAELNALWGAVNLDGADPEIAAVRIKLEAALRCDPSNARVRRDAARILSRCYRARYRLTGEEVALFKKFVRGMLEAAAVPEARDETNRGRSAAKLPENTKRIEAEKSLETVPLALEGMF